MIIGRPQEEQDLLEARDVRLPADCVAVSQIPRAIRGIKQIVVGLNAVECLDEDGLPVLTPFLFYSWSGIQRKWLPAVAAKTNKMVGYSSDERYLQFDGVVYNPDVTALDIGKQVFLSRTKPGTISLTPTQNLAGIVVAEKRILLNLEGLNRG